MWKPAFANPSSATFIREKEIREEFVSIFIVANIELMHARIYIDSDIKVCLIGDRAKYGPTSNVGVSNVGVFKRRSHQTQESQTSECSNAGVGQTSDCSTVGVIIA